MSEAVDRHVLRLWEFHPQVAAPRISSTSSADNWSEASGERSWGDNVSPPTGP